MSFFSKKLFKFLLFVVVSLFFFIIIQDAYAPPPPPPPPPAFPPYTNSAHGSSSYGVNRTSLASFGYSIGNCAHCHEQHASIGGDEPTPDNDSASKYLLFRTLFANQGGGFCFPCHKAPGSSLQTAMPNQYSYSRMAGGYSETCPGDIQEAFAFVDDTGIPQLNCTVTTGSSHFLEDIQNFLGNIGATWNFSGTAGNNNPCSGCHNPHRAQRDPHTVGSRGWPVSRPSQHSTDNNAWGLWGDDSGERMNSYTGGYQAPYRSGGTTYEPDGSLTTDGSNLTDYVTFCTDCHNSTNTIYSTVLGRNLYPINWNTEKHGSGAASDDGTFIDVKSPYQDALCGSYVLSCTDCHEPHGSPNPFLIRKEVNNGTFTYPSARGYWRDFCGRCHNQMGHTDPGFPGPHDIVAISCTDCHNIHTGNYTECIICHYHGGSYAGDLTF
jgi:hypothetical protein